MLESGGPARRIGRPATGHREPAGVRARQGRSPLGETELDPAPPSLFDRWIARPKHRWRIVAFAVACLLAPFFVAWLEGYLPQLLREGLWRDALVAPTIITYILAVAPFQSSADERALTSLHSLLIQEEAGLDRPAGGQDPRRELLAFGAGVLLVVLLSAQTVLVDFTWLELIMLIESGLEYGLLGVVIYGSLASTRMTNALLRQPMRIDPLEVTPFEAVGRQGLSLALVFVGGITLSLLFVGAHPEAFLQWQLYVVYAPLILMPMLVFFLSMAPTHRRLQAARDGELRRVQDLIRRECADLVRRIETDEEPTACAQRVTALTAYEARLLGARTWPYNTTMLRTVFVSVLIPGATMVGRILAELLKR